MFIKIAQTDDNSMIFYELMNCAGLFPGIRASSDKDHNYGCGNILDLPKTDLAPGTTYYEYYGVVIHNAIWNNKASNFNLAFMKQATLPDSNGYSISLPW